MKGQNKKRFDSLLVTPESELKEFIDLRNQLFFRLKYFKATRIKKPILGFGTSEEKHLLHDGKIFTILFHFAVDKKGYIQCYIHDSQDKFDERRRVIKMYSALPKFPESIWFELNPISKKKYDENFKNNIK